MSARAILVAISLCLLNGRTTLTGAQPLVLTVAPKIAPEPGYVRVRVRIEPDADNRMLEVTALSDEYSRTSEIPLNGSSAPRLSIIDYPNLPSGTYEVHAVLLGSKGNRATMRSVVQIVGRRGNP
jgi:hypothetical protein